MERQREKDRQRQRQQTGQGHALSWSGGEDCLLERRVRELSMVMEIFYILFWIIASWAYTIAKAGTDHWKSVHFYKLTRLQLKRNIYFVYVFERLIYQHCFFFGNIHYPH